MAAVFAVDGSKYTIAGFNMDLKTMAMALAVIFCVLVPFDLVQLSLAASGAFAYYFLAHAGFMPAPASHKDISPGKGAAEGPAPELKRRHRAAAASLEPAGPRTRTRPSTASGADATGTTNRRPQHAVEKATGVHPPVPSPSVQPVAAPTFKAAGFENQVRELLAQITPDAETDKVVEGIARAVQQQVQKIIPEAEVAGVACGGVHGRGAFGVAVPDVDMVVHVSPDALMRRLANQGAGRGSGPEQKLEAARRWQKSAIRACTDCLVTSGLFKFRRSAFRGSEPKVTLLVPPSSGLCSTAVPIDLSVNSATPLHSAALLADCGLIEPRAKDLILLVRRWARDRGICHSSKGHLPPYAWTLLAIYYLQVGVGSNGPLLPPLDRFAKSSGLLGTAAAPSASWAPPAPEGPAASVGALFAGFARFLHGTVDWRKEAADVRRGKRAQPAATADINVVVGADGATRVGPTIPDPFEPRRNVAAGVTDAGLARLAEELARAVEFCAREGQLAELLEPWHPDWEDADAEKAGTA